LPENLDTRVFIKNSQVKIHHLVFSVCCSFILLQVADLPWRNQHWEEGGGVAVIGQCGLIFGGRTPLLRRWGRRLTDLWWRGSTVSSVGVLLEKGCYWQVAVEETEGEEGRCWGGGFGVDGGFLSGCEMKRSGKVERQLWEGRSVGDGRRAWGLSGLGKSWRLQGGEAAWWREGKALLREGEGLWKWGKDGDSWEGPEALALWFRFFGQREGRWFWFVFGQGKGDGGTALVEIDVGVFF
jgi:hypothetical protein